MEGKTTIAIVYVYDSNLQRKRNKAITQKKTCGCKNNGKKS